MTAGRIGWAVLGLLLVAVAIRVSVQDGVVATTAAVVFVFLPTVRWWPLRAAWIPLAALVVFTVWPVWPPLFSAGLGWLIGIAGMRAFNLAGAGATVAGPQRLGMRVLGLDLAPGAAEPEPASRREPGPQAGRAAIPKPDVAQPRPAAERPGPSAEQAGPAADRPEAGVERPDPPEPAADRPDPPGPGANPGPGNRPAPRLRANRTPRAAASPESKNAAKPKPAARPDPGPAANPQRNPEPGSGSGR